MEDLFKFVIIVAVAFSIALWITFMIDPPKKTFDESELERKLMAHRKQLEELTQIRKELDQ